MFGKAQIITNHGEVLASFIEGKKLPFSSTKFDRFLNVVQHQSASLEQPIKIEGKANMGCKEIDIDCICTKRADEATENFDLSKIAMAGSLLWLDPTYIPVECLASILNKWLNNCSPSSHIGLGIVIRSAKTSISEDGPFRAWISTPSGSLEKEFNGIDLPVWYPSLAREPKFLEKITEAITPFDVFPIVEFPEIVNYAAEKSTALHHHLLDHYRTRTRNFIYLNNTNPTEALITLYKSFRAIPKTGKMPKSLVITPGGSPLSYFVTLLAGVFAEGC